MSSEVSEQELYRLARNRLAEKKGVYTHFAVRLAMNALLVVIWFVTGHPGNKSPWFVFSQGATGWEKKR
ncbi:MAG: 2TM domain-containing protein [Chloroflexi bacterium]|nr:2TM domain-containing protein [Chloroflexota bacterium]